MQVFIKAKTICNRLSLTEYITGYSLDDDGDCDGVDFGNANQAMVFDVKEQADIIYAIREHLTGYEIKPALESEEHTVLGIEISPVKPLKFIA